MTKEKIDRIRRQQIRESCGIQVINEWVERRRRRRRREWDEYETRMNAEILVKISRDNIPAGSSWLKQTELPTTKKKKKKNNLKSIFCLHRIRSITFVLEVMWNRSD